ncbi:MAG: hypothetical protein NTW38_07980 [Candidatus Aminicenantes bacterium]|nr:hypothetical protein [Candidatus Aminicenantes bacterium]
MGNDWLQPGESEVGSWTVYVGGEGPMAAKVTGKIHITNINFHFAAGMSLEKNAASMISNRIKAFEKSEEHLTIPFAEIAGGEIVKKGFLLKSLVVKLKTGEEIPFHFGAMNPQKALDALNAGLKK